MFKKTASSFPLGFLIVLLSIAMVAAQSNCTALVEEALSAVSLNCEGLGRNTACYGYDQVEASFLVSVEDDYFTSPSNTSPVADIATIRTAPFNENTGVWGVAVMNLQANLPNTLPGQNVTFILLGDVEVENAVAPEEAFQGSEGIEIVVSSSAGANVRSGAGTNFNVVGGLREGERVLADGLSPDGDWLRIAFRERPAWISRSVIADNPAIDELPVLSNDLNTPMQAIYLRTGIGQSACDDAIDDVLLVQGPENIEIQITVNGANIELGSSGALRVIYINGQPFLEIIVFDGTFAVDGQEITRGQRSILCLGDENSRGLDGENNDLVVTCPASEPEIVDIDEFGEEWCIVEDIPEDLLNYSLEVLCPGETPPPAETQTVNNTSEIQGVDCSGFAITTSTVPATNFTLNWTAATGADSYEVAIFDNSGYQVAVHSGITGTSFPTNGGAFPPSGYVDVRAYQAGVYACYTRLNFNRTPDPNEPIGGYSNFTANFSYCEWNDGLSFTVTWANATGGVTIYLGSNTWTVPNNSGSYSQNYIPVDVGTPLSINTEGAGITLICPS